MVLGDITTQDVDAVANAANNRMRGDGGMDGAIHRCLAVADSLAVSSVAFPLISAGVCGWPLDDAALAAVTTWRTTQTSVTQAQDRVPSSFAFPEGPPGTTIFAVAFIE